MVRWSVFFVGPVRTWLQRRVVRRALDAARRHVAFGFGTHQCLGQSLARMELQVALPRLFERIPDLRLAVSEDDLPFKTNSIVYGLRNLMLTWGERT